MLDRLSSSPNSYSPFFIASEIYRTTNHGRHHPLAIPRVSLTMDICRELGWLHPGNFIDSPCATVRDLARFHDPGYIDAVAAAERTGDAPENIRRRHQIGTNGNPIFDGMYSRSATACGGGMLGAQILMNNETDRVYAPGGGQHHARSDLASGFCFFNEPVLSILTMLECGAGRVFYLDLDAHHGDGVQDAFAYDEQVFTLSIHEEGRWPMARDGSGSGSASDRAGGAARNLPVPAGFNDQELEYLTESVILPLIAEFIPDAVYVQCGADSLADDPQSKLLLSNIAIWQTVAAVASVAPKILVAGGGGYNPYAVGRCWSGIWATLRNHPIPEELPEAAQACLRAVVWQHRLGRNVPDYGVNTLADRTNVTSVRKSITQLARRTLEH